MTTERDSRVSDCQRLLADHDAEALAISTSANMRYLSGFTDEPSERHLLLFVPVTGDPVFVIPKMYKKQIDRNQESMTYERGQILTARRVLLMTPSPIATRWMERSSLTTRCGRRFYLTYSRGSPRHASSVRVTSRPRSGCGRTRQNSMRFDEIGNCFNTL
jgi:hypothetical protein